MKLWLQGLCELARRYCSIFKAVWSERKQLETAPRQNDEAAFLPAHLELVETPVSPLPKWIARAIIFFFLLALIWASVGTVEIVAVASGKILPNGRSKTIQPIETASVKHVYVKNGQQIKKGDLLVELTGIGVEAEYSKSEAQLKAAMLTQLRQQALFIAIRENKKPEFLEDTQSKQVISSQDALYLQEQELAYSQYNTWIAQKQKLQALIEQKHSELNTIEIEIKKTSSILKYEKEKREDFHKLYQKGHISKHEHFIQINKVIELENEMSIYKSKIKEIKSQISQVEKELLVYIETFKKNILEELRQASETVTQLFLEVEKTKQRQQFMSIYAPVDGIVQQLQTYTIGGVVTTAQPLMVIVPTEEKLEVEAMVSNKDIGFIKTGQSVVIKLDAFPYTRYGYITGEVKNISFDAVQDEKMGLIFPVTIVIEKNYLIIEDKKVYLLAGMTINAEIKTGERSIMDYLLSPIKTTVDESLRER